MKRAISLFAPVFLVSAAIVASSATAHAESEIVSEVRAVPAFRAVELAGTLKVEVTVGAPARVEISAGTDVIGKVSTTVKDGVLVIDTRSRLRNQGPIRAIVTVPALSGVTISGTGQMEVHGIASDRFAVSLPGTGGVKLTGSTGALDLRVDGTGEVSAKELAAKDATVEISGTGSATLRATQSLEATVTGTGNISVHGKPARVRKSVSGLGNIKIH